MTAIDIEERILNKLRTLPASKRKQALVLIESLAEPSQTSPAKSSRGLWADLNVDVTSADIDEARQEMWADFPRDIDL